MTQILTRKAEKPKNNEKSEYQKVRREITNLIIQLQISPIYFNRVLDLFVNAKKTQKFNCLYDKFLLAVCFYRLNLEKKLYISLKSIKNRLNIRSHAFLSNHLRLYNKFCKSLNLKPIHFTQNDHISNICDIMGLGDEIKNKAINLVKMINNNFLLPGEYRTCAITSIYFASNFGGEQLSIDHFDFYFDLISQSVLYNKIKIFEKYMKEYFRRKAQKTKLNNRERYFLDNYTAQDRLNFFRKFKSIRN